MTTRTHRRTTRAGIAAVAVATLIVTFALPAFAAPTTPAAASARAHARYVPIVGNGRYLVYAEASRRSTISPVTFGGNVDLYVLRATGTPTLLGTADGAPRLVSLSRDTLVITNPGPKGHERIRWWDLATGRHSNLVTSEQVVGARPGGWLFEVDKEDGTHVFSQAFDGSNLIDYGIPLSTGVDFSVSSGPDGFVAYADNDATDNGEISYTRWAHPSHHRTLLSPGGSQSSCHSVTSAYAACVLWGEATHPVALFPLNHGGSTTAGGDCPYDATVWGSRLAWISRDHPKSCATKHVGVLSHSGTANQTTATFNTLSITSAWGHLVMASPGQRSLETLRTVRGKAHPLSRTKV